MKKTILSLALFACSAFTVSAQQLLVKSISGKEESHSLQDVSRIIFHDGEIRLASSSERLIQAYSYENVKYLSLSGFPTDIVAKWSAENPGDNGVTYYNNTRSLFIVIDSKYYQEYGRYVVKIQTEDGVLVKQKPSPYYYSIEDFTLSVDISDLVPGTYVVTITGIASNSLPSFKFMK